jgi:hypothetical protein
VLRSRDKESCLSLLRFRAPTSDAYADPYIKNILDVSAYMCTTHVLEHVATGATTWNPRNKKSVFLWYSLDTVDHSYFSGTILVSVFQEFSKRLRADACIWRRSMGSKLLNNQRLRYSNYNSCVTDVWCLHRLCRARVCPFGRSVLPDLDISYGAAFGRSDRERWRVLPWRLLEVRVSVVYPMRTRFSTIPENAWSLHINTCGENTSCVLRHIDPSLHTSCPFFISVLLHQIWVF